MKVALYARVATQRQGDEGAAFQIEALRAHASKGAMLWRPSSVITLDTVVCRWIALA
jgi:DNA invertase Pin-like site-specific DNA recombinase